MATVKNNLPAKAYADRAAQAMNDLAARANRGSANTVNMSVGNISRDPEAGATKTSGIKIRGTGAATKGTMARGPMA
jgi:hypothetical protein